MARHVVAAVLRVGVGFIGNGCYTLRTSMEDAVKLKILLISGSPKMEEDRRTNCQS
jgi:hypothetical protein